MPNSGASARSILVAASLLAGCAPLRGGSTALSPHGAPCPAGAEAMVKAALFFGRSIPGGGEVTDSAWAAFVTEEVASRFPDGFTVVDANGHWRDARGSVARERTFLLMILHPQVPAADSAVRQISDAYRRRFAQEAVLRERSPVCVVFDR
jgi:uncharacterized protein DUF3574